MSQEFPAKSDENSDSDSEGERRPPTGSLALDLGDDCVYNVDTNRLGSQSGLGTSGVQEATSKREDNPFSFKHFLRDNNSSSRNYQLLGAKPKAYRESRSRHVTPPESPQRSSRKINEFSSALPDFVQDHLVIEQCFLGNKSSSSTTTGVGGFKFDLPDFGQGDQQMQNGPMVSRSNSIEEPGLGPIPLDLPGLSLGTNAFPLDLPSGNPIGQSQISPAAEVGTSKSLPDFLTDGPVLNNADGLTPSPTIPESPRCHRCSELTLELASTKQQLSQTVDELDRNYRRALAADNTIARLKQELKTLKVTFRQVQAENEILRQAQGAAGGARGDGPLEMQVHSLAQELRGAATIAEHSLRSLLTGVDNLRSMASALENMHRIEDKPSERFSSYDDDSAGPAL